MLECKLRIKNRLTGPGGQARCQADPPGHQRQVPLQKQPSGEQEQQVQPYGEQEQLVEPEGEQQQLLQPRGEQQQLVQPRGEQQQLVQPVESRNSWCSPWRAGTAGEEEKRGQSGSRARVLGILCIGHVFNFAIWGIPSSTIRKHP